MTGERLDIFGNPVDRMGPYEDWADSWVCSAESIVLHDQLSRIEAEPNRIRNREFDREAGLES